MKQTAKKNPTQRISDFTAYHTLSEKQVLTKIHHLEDPPEKKGGAAVRGDTLDNSAFSFAKDKRGWSSRPFVASVNPLGTAPKEKTSTRASATSPP